MPALKRIVWLDGLRALCALCVLFHHALTIFPAPLRELRAAAPMLAALATFISRRNTEAVLVFFVLSGLSIRLSVEQRGLRSAAAVNDYLYRRLRRILPLYWAALALSGLVALGCAPVSPRASSALTLLGNLLFLQTASGVRGQWVVPYAGNEALWSLSFELFFYLMYPVLVRRVERARRRMSVVLLASLVGFAGCVLAPNPFLMFLAAAPLWYFGVELAECYLHGVTALPWPFYVALWCLLLALRIGPYGVLVHGTWLTCTLLLAGLALMRSPLRLQHTERLWQSAALRPLLVLGDASYALYLLHVPVLRAFAARLGGGALPMLAAVSCSLALAVVAEHRLGRAQLRWLKRDYLRAEIA